jgi:hypothetical protein
LTEDDFTQVIPLLRRSFAGFDGMARRRLFQAVFEQKPVHAGAAGGQTGTPDNPAFEAAIPLLHRILGVTS